MKNYKPTFIPNPYQMKPLEGELRLQDLKVGDRFTYKYPDGKFDDDFSRTITEISEWGMIHYRYDHDHTITYFFGKGSRWHLKEVTLVEPALDTKEVVEPDIESTLHKNQLT